LEFCYFPRRLRIFLEGREREHMRFFYVGLLFPIIIFFSILQKKNFHLRILDIRVPPDPYFNSFTESNSLFNFYNFDPTKLPPSKAIVAPLTYAPALLDKNKHAPATSSGLPILPSGIPATIASPKSFKVAALILLSNGPQANVLEVIFLFPR